MISIIVPIYNVEKYLEPCVESILNSTYKDFELILVDDGSTDGSGEICERYAIKDNRVRVIHKSNGGVSDARNTGLKMAIGSYLMFVDGDDVIHPQMIEILFNSLTSDDYDLSAVRICPVAQSENNKYLSIQLPVSLDTIELSREEYERRISNDSTGQFLGPWAKLFKKSLIEGLWFKPLASEDAEWNVRLALRIRKAILLDQELYFYVLSENSLTRANKGINRTIVDRLMTHLYCLDEIPRERKKFRMMWCRDLYKRMIYTNYLTRSTEYFNEVNHICSLIYEKTKKEFLRSDMSLIDKIKYLVCIKCPYSFFLLNKMGFLLASKKK